MTPDCAAVSISASVVAGPLRDAMRNTWSSPVTALDFRQPAQRSLQPVGVAEKLTSSMFLPGTDALSFIGESSAFSSP